MARPSKMAPCKEWGELLTGPWSSGRGYYAEEELPSFSLTPNEATSKACIPLRQPLSLQLSPVGVPCINILRVPSRNP